MDAIALATCGGMQAEYTHSCLLVIQAPMLLRFICTCCCLSTLQGLAGGQADLGLGQGGTPIPEDRRPEQGRGQHQEDQEEGGWKVWVAGARKVGKCSCQQRKGGAQGGGGRHKGASERLQAVSGQLGWGVSAQSAGGLVGGQVREVGAGGPQHVTPAAPTCW